MISSKRHTLIIKHKKKLKKKFTLNKANHIDNEKKITEVKIKCAQM